MSETPKKVNLDAALRQWPTAEKPAMDWDEMARKIDAGVAAGEPAVSIGSVSNENLLAEPLGQIEADGHNSAFEQTRVKAEQTRVPKGETMTMPVDRERDRRSLQDLAKMAATGMTPPPVSVRAPLSSGASATSAPSGSGVQRAAEAAKDDSGIIDLAAASQADPQAALRAQTTPLASEGLFDEEPGSIRPPPVSSGALSGPLSGPLSGQLRQPAPTIPPALSASPASVSPLSASQSALAGSFAGPSSAASPSSVASSSQQIVAKKGNGAVIALVLGGLVAVSAVAAGGVFYMKSRAAAAELALNTPKIVVPVATSAPATPAPVETANAAPTPADPNAAPAPADPAPKAVVVAKGGPATTPVAKADKPVKEDGAKLSQKDLPPSSALPEGDLSKAMGKAVGADGKPVDATPAAGPSGPQFQAGSVPQRPSQGAVTGAIGAVLPGARACLGPDDAVSRATVTFGSAGSVQSVSVSGGAAGKPAEGCIKAALGKAKVAPFAEATYAAPITIRH